MLLLPTAYCLLPTIILETKFAPVGFGLWCLFCQNREEKIASGWKGHTFHVDDRCRCCGLLPVLPVAVRWALPDRAPSDANLREAGLYDMAAKGTGVSFIMRPCREHVDGHGASNQLVGIVTPRVAGVFVMMGRIVKGNPVLCVARSG